MFCQFEFPIWLNKLKLTRKVIAKRLAQDALRQVMCKGEYISSANLVAGNVPAKIITAIIPIETDKICEDGIRWIAFCYTEQNIYNR